MADPAPPPYTIFGAPVSLYTGKVRCYLRKNHIPFVERLPSDPRFQNDILPAIGRFMNPVLLTADGEIVQDTTVILDWFDSRGLGAIPLYPATPLQKLVALALDVFGNEGLVRPAMHYRWSFRAQQEDFLQHEFGLAMRAAGVSAEKRAERVPAMMHHFNSYLPALGVTEATIPAIEAAYEELMARLDDHFRAWPYALGGRPTCADYGLIAPLWAHLGRDPYPADQMKRRAPSLYRWVERMQASDPDTPEFPTLPYALADDDSLPDTLAPVLACLARDVLPELEAAAAVVDAWLAKHPEAEVGAPAAGSPDGRGFRSTKTFDLRGVAIPARVNAYQFFNLQRVTDAFAALDGLDRARVGTYFAAVGLERLLTLRTARRIERRNHIEVWGAPIA